MNKEKLQHYANVLASHAGSYWVTPIFFLLFFIDSIILIIPVDSLLAATISLRPQGLKKWLIASVIGFASGLGLVAILVNTQLQPWFLNLFESWGYLDRVYDIINQAQDYGYWALTLGVFTLLPSLFGVLIGVLVHLNPWAVWAIALAGKLFKLFLTVWLIFSGSLALRKWLRLYLKTSL